MSADERTEDVCAAPAVRRFGPDDLEPPENFDGEAKPKFELVIGPKHLAIALFLLVTQMGLVAGIAYTVGKSAALRQHPAIPAAAMPMAVPHPSVAPVAPVEPVGPPSGETSVVPEPDEGAAAPPAGLYLQTGSIDLAAARQSVLELARKGYQSRLAPGSSDGVYRVLVGPVTDAQVRDTADSLRKAGFDCFPKRY